MPMSCMASLPRDFLVRDWVIIDPNVEEIERELDGVEGPQSAAKYLLLRTNLVIRHHRRPRRDSVPLEACSQA